MRQLAYRFFDSDILLEGEDQGVIDYFERVYSRFRIAGAADTQHSGVSLRDQSGSTVDAYIDQPTEHGPLVEYACNAILNNTIARVRSHFLFHAGAVSTTHDDGVVLAGDSGMGKTTLTCALLENGFRLLSDDVAAVGRTDGRLYGFPRPLGLRSEGGWPGEKRFVDAEELVPGSSCGTDTQVSYPARFLFVLEDPAANAGQPDWYLVVEGAPEELLADLAAVDGVRSSKLVRSEPYSAVHLDVAPGTLPARESEIAQACARHQILLFEVIRGRERPPDFNLEPELSRLSASEAALELLRHFKGGPRSELLRRDFGRSPARLLMAVARLTGTMRCYRLSVGRLDAMIEAITGAIAGLQQRWRSR